MKKKLLYCLFAIVIVGIGALFTGYFYLQQFANQRLAVTQNNQQLIVARGTSVYQLARQLEQVNLISDAGLLPYWARFHPNESKIKSGTYQLTVRMTLQELMQLLASGKELQFSIKLVEGKRAKDWLQQLAIDNNITNTLTELSEHEIAAKIGLNDTVLEGWLYPETYHFIQNATDLELLKRAYESMQTKLQEVWNDRDDDLPYKTPYELLIMASIIEKETGVDAERAKIASVFINRLKYNMRLETDPTVIYGMGDDYKGKVFSKNLRDKTNPYNTYVIFGLPPTPIAMPSFASLQAAAHPDQTNYLFFVADGYGGHVFSKNYPDHNRAVKQYWQLMKERNKN